MATVKSTVEGTSATPCSPPLGARAHTPKRSAGTKPTTTTLAMTADPLTTVADESPCPPRDSVRVPCGTARGSHHTARGTMMGRSRVAPCPVADEPSPFEPFFPSVSEFVRALWLMDTDGDGKVWEADVDMLVEIGYGITAAETAGRNSREGKSAAEDAWREVSGCQEEGRLKMWTEMKAGCMEWDGLLDVKKVAQALMKGPCCAELVRLGNAHLDSFMSALALGQGRRTRRGRSNLQARGLCGYVRAFKKFDGDNNGVICARDLKDSLKQMSNIEFSIEMCKEIIRKVDRNRDGVVDLVEFCSLIGILG